MDKVLKLIDQQFLAVPSEEDRTLVRHEIINIIISKMKTINPLFNILFENEFYGDKVMKYDEYCVHLKCRLPYKEVLKSSNVPGWINLKFTREKLPQKKRKRRPKPYYGIVGMHVLMRQDYLDTEKVMLWLHQTLSCALGGRKTRKKRHCTIPTSHGNFDLVFKRHGPTMKFHASGMVDNEKIEIDWDCVLCFCFGNEQYPVNGFLPNPYPDKESFIVYKQPAKDFLTDDMQSIYWRISFQVQERDLLEGKEHLKPALRLMKKLKIKRKHKCIENYFIKNLFLCQLHRPESFWSEPLSVVFITILIYYQNCIEKSSIDFYWYATENLLSHVKSEDLKMVQCDLQKIILEFKNHSNSRNAIAKLFLTRGEFKRFKSMSKNQN